MVGRHVVATARDRCTPEGLSDVEDLSLGTQLVLMLRLVVALVLGAVVGWERELQRMPAGFRTHALVALGSAIFTVISAYAFTGPGSDPTRIAAQVVTGIGFLGGGAIIHYGGTVRGLTTAASLWAVAAVGMAAGAGLFRPRDRQRGAGDRGPRDLRTPRTRGEATLQHSAHQRARTDR